MDTGSLTVGAIVAALIAKAGGRTIDAAVDGGEGLVRGIAERLRRRFSAADDCEATEALSLVERVPDSPSLVTELAAVIDRHAAVDAAFAVELEALARRASGAGVDIGSINQVALRDRTVQIAGVADSRISVTQGQPSEEPAK